MTIQIKATEPCFPVVLFNMINKAVLTIDYVKKKIKLMLLNSTSHGAALCFLFHGLKRLPAVNVFLKNSGAREGPIWSGER